MIRKILGIAFVYKKKSTKKRYSYGKLSSENNFVILIILISRWQLLSSRCQLSRGYVTAKAHVSLCVAKQTNILGALKVVFLWNLWESSKKEKKARCFSFSKPRPMKGEKAFSCDSAADQQVLSTAKTNGFKKSKNMNTNQIRVKSSRLKWVQAVLQLGQRKPKKIKKMLDRGLFLVSP